MERVCLPTNTYIWIQTSSCAVKHNALLKGPPPGMILWTYIQYFWFIFVVFHWFTQPTFSPFLSIHPKSCWLSWCHQFPPHLLCPPLSCLLSLWRWEELTRGAHVRGERGRQGGGELILESGNDWLVVSEWQGMGPLPSAFVPHTHGKHLQKYAYLYNVFSQFSFILYIS